MLLKHTYLMSEDFGALGEDAAAHRQYWITNMENTIPAERHMQRGSVVDVSMPRFMHHKWRDQHTRRSLGLGTYRH